MSEAKKSIAMTQEERASLTKTMGENGVVHETGVIRSTYETELDPLIVKSPYFPIVHALVQQELNGAPLIIAGAVALDKKTADSLRAGTGEHPALDEQQISERVMELAARMWAQQGLQRCDFTTLPNAEGDEATVAFTAVVLHPNDFGQLMGNIEMLVVRLIEKLMAEVAEVPYGFHPGQTPPPAMN